MLVPTTYENEDGETVHADAEVIVEPGTTGFVWAFVDELPSPFDCNLEALADLPVSSSGLNEDLSRTEKYRLLSKMSDSRFSLYLDCFTFGGSPRRIFYGVILEGVFLLGLFSFTSEGLLDTSVVPRFTEMITLAAIVTGIGTYYVSRSAAKDSFSAILHMDFVPGLVAAGYLFLGELATGIGFLLHTWVYQTSLPPTNQEIWIGLCIGVIFGFSILFYFDRYEIETPDDYYQFEKASERLIEAKEFLEKTDLPPIDLTGRYNALGDSMQEIADVLKKAETRDGARLAQDVEACLDDFRGRPEPSKHLIAGSSQSPEQQELKDRRENFQSVVKRIKRIANHG